MPNSSARIVMATRSSMSVNPPQRRETPCGTLPVEGIELALKGGVNDIGASRTDQTVRVHGPGLRFHAVLPIKRQTHTNKRVRIPLSSFRHGSDERKDFNRPLSSVFQHSADAVANFKVRE